MEPAAEHLVCPSNVIVIYVDSGIYDIPKQRAMPPHPAADVEQGGALRQGDVGLHKRPAVPVAEWQEALRRGVDQWVFQQAVKHLPCAHDMLPFMSELRSGIAARTQSPHVEF